MIGGALGAAGTVRRRRLDALAHWWGCALGALISATLFVESAVAPTHGLAALAVDTNAALRTSQRVGAIDVDGTSGAAEVVDQLADEVVLLWVAPVFVTAAHSLRGGGALVVVGAGTGRAALSGYRGCEGDDHESDGEGASDEGHCG